MQNVKFFPKYYPKLWIDDGIAKFFFLLVSFGPLFHLPRYDPKVWINGRKDGFSKTLIYYHLSFTYWPLSIFQDSLNGRWWVWNLFLFCNCWWQPFPLPKSLLWAVLGAQEWTCYPTNFSFRSQRWVKIQYVPHLKSENYEIASVKSNTLRAFQQYQDSTLISLNFIVFSSLNLQWKICTIFRSSSNIHQNISKPPRWTLLILGIPTIARVQ